jgi:hypothetical protein
VIVRPVTSSQWRKNKVAVACSLRLKTRLAMGNVSNFVLPVVVSFRSPKLVPALERISTPPGVLHDIVSNGYVNSYHRTY